jgi:hypothetical protein
MADTVANRAADPDRAARPKGRALLPSGEVRMQWVAHGAHECGRVGAASQTDVRADRADRAVGAGGARR